MVYPIIKILFPLVRALFLKKVTGLKNLPKKGGFIIAANHPSTIDPILLVTVIGSHLNRTIHFLTAAKFNRWYYAPFIKLLGGIFVNGSTEESRAALEKGNILGLFPEGARSSTGEIRKVKHTGIAVLELLTKKPIIPVGIRGAFEIWPRSKRLWRFKKTAELHIGKPIYLRGKPTKTNINKGVSRVMNSIARLAKQKR